MNANFLPPPESREEIFTMRTQPLPATRFKTTYQRLLTYFLFYPALSILALAFTVFFLGFPFLIFASILKWIRYLWKQKTAEEIRPWFMQSPPVAILTYTLGWIALGAKLPFEALGSILTRGNLFLLACFIGMYIYLSVVACLEFQADEQREQSESARERESQGPLAEGARLGVGVRNSAALWWRVAGTQRLSILSEYLLPAWRRIWTAWRACAHVSPLFHR